MNREFSEAPRNRETKSGPGYVIPEFSVPDMPDLDMEAEPEVWRREQEVRVPVTFKGEDFVATIKAERNKAKNFKYSRGGPFASLQIEFHRAGEEEERVSLFRSVLNHRVPEGKRSPKDRGRHVYWAIITRLVDDESMRGSGFGKANLELTEKAMEEMTKAMGDVEPEWIEISTYLGSVASMIIDREWLAEELTKPGSLVSESDLDALGPKADRDEHFGYQPIPSQSNSALQLLQQRTQKLDDAPSGSEEIIFIKMLDGSSADEVF
ncbi:hypothetical protein HOI18_02040 [Candidatus Uhrbacteria bacterium]|jgi:hypothetical protein|nr:hypothetical protein [Candidatus Uhrbacteria bacterium]